MERPRGGCPACPCDRTIGRGAGGGLAAIVSLVTALLAAAVCNVNWVLLCSSFLSIWREVSEWQEQTRDCSPHRYPKTCMVLSDSHLVRNRALYVNKGCIPMWPKGGVWWKAEDCQGLPPGRPTPLTAPEMKPPGNSAPAVGRSRFATMIISESGGNKQ